MEEPDVRMAELADRSGVSVATIKYYRREGLLPAGRSTAPNQADYGPRHVTRLRLVRALREVAGLSIADIRHVLRAVDDPDRAVHDVVGAAHRALDPAGEPLSDPTHDHVDAVVDRAGWDVAPDAPARATLGRALAALDGLGMPTDAGALDRYVAAADRIAADEVEATFAASTGREDLVTRVVVGTVLYEQVLTALRRLAQEHHSARRG